MESKYRQLCLKYWQITLGVIYQNEENINNIDYISIHINTILASIIEAQFTNIDTVTLPSFPHSWLITAFVSRIRRRVPLEEQELLTFSKQELLTFSEHTSSPPC